MRSILMVLALAIGGCCTTGSDACKKEGKAMSCDMKKAGCSCCAKGGAQEHQH